MVVSEGNLPPCPLQCLREHQYSHHLTLLMHSQQSHFCKLTPPPPACMSKAHGTSGGEIKHSSVPTKNDLLVLQSLMLGSKLHGYSSWKTQRATAPLSCGMWPGFLVSSRCDFPTNHPEANRCPEQGTAVTSDQQPNRLRLSVFMTPWAKPT